MNITFIQLHAAHFPLLLKWLESPHVKKWWDQNITYTPNLIKEKFESYTKGYKPVNGVNKPIYAYIINLDKNPIGYIQIYNAHDFIHHKLLINLPENLGALDIFIGEESYLGKNIGSQAITKFLELYSNNYTHVVTDPASDNLTAIKSYEKAGFKKILDKKDPVTTWMIKRTNKVRLSEHDLDAIEALFYKHFLPGDKLWLFGSRADLSKRGGDIDLYIETAANNINDAMKMKADFIWDLEKAIGEQKIDVVLNLINFPYTIPIHSIAKAEGVRII